MLYINEEAALKRISDMLEGAKIITTSARETGATTGVDIAHAYILDVQGMLEQIAKDDCPFEDLVAMLQVMAVSHGIPAAQLGARLLAIATEED